MVWAAAGVTDVADDDPNLFMLMMVILMVFSVAAIIAVLLSVIAALVVIMLAGAGILSYSLVKGWRQRSLSTMARTFVRLTLVSGGLLIGGEIVLILAVFDVPFIHSPVYVAAIFAVAGITGWVCYRLVVSIFRYILNKL